MDSHAQLEIQELAKEISDIIAPLFPVAWAQLVGEIHARRYNRRIRNIQWCWL